MIERVTTGIPGLDTLMSGGFVKGSTVLVTGGTGTGKTTFCTQYLMEGLRKGENCLYMSLEEDPESIKEDMIQYGWNLAAYEKKGLLKVVYQNPFEVADIGANLVNNSLLMKATRVVIDSISLLGMYLKEEAVTRKKLFQLIRLLRKSGATTLITSEILDNEIGERGGSLSREGVIEFLVDGVVILNLFGIGAGISRSILIRKMRRTKHDRDNT